MHPGSIREPDKGAVLAELERHFIERLIVETPI